MSAFTLTSFLSQRERKINQRRNPMRRKILSAVLGAVFLAIVSPAEAQQAKNVPRVAVLGKPANLVGLGTVRETEAAARSLGVRIQVLDVSEPDKLEGAFSAIAGELANGLIGLTDPMFTGQRQRILGLVEKSRL